MADDATDPREAVALAPRVIGHVGLWASAAGALACLALIATAAGRPGAGHRLLAGLLWLPVAALALWQFAGFLRLADWSVAPELPLGLKLLGHLGRVCGSLAVAACLALAVLTVVFPGRVPPQPVREVGGVWLRVAPGDSGYGAPRPALAALYVLAVFPSLALRMLGTAVAEMRRWARLGSLFAFGGAVALLTVALVLNLTRWRVGVATLPLAVGDVLAGAVFLSLLVYFSLPETIEAFESHGL